MDPTRHGAFSWHELMTTDLDGARRFYGGLFGWTFEEHSIQAGPMQGEPYIIVKAGGEDTAGLMPMPQGHGRMPPAWGTYITVDSLEEAVAKVRELGGQVHVDPTPVPGHGRFAVISDPQGAFLSLFEFKKR
jgi:uncharacterized protein